MKINKTLVFISILFSIILILTSSFSIVLGLDLFSLGLLAYLLTWFLFLPIFFLRVLIYSINQLSTYKLGTLLPLIIVLLSVSISFLIDPVKVDFYLYLNQREKAVAMIEAGQIETVKQLIKNNPSSFHVRSVQIQKQLIFQDDKQEIEEQVITSIYLTRYTIGFGEGSRGYIYTKDKEYTAELNRREAKQLKEYWYWS